MRDRSLTSIATSRQPRHPQWRGAWLLLAGFMLIWGGAVQGAWVQGSGEALVRQDNVQRARDEAVAAALRDAALRYKAKVSTHEQVVNGAVRENRLNVSSDAHVRSMRVIREERLGRTLRVTVEADLSDGMACEARPGARLRKRVGVLAFPLVAPNDASLGQLNNVSWQLAAMLHTRLQSSAQVQPFAAHDRTPYVDLTNAPTLRENDARLHKTLDTAREMGVQFLVTGVIREISPVDAQAWDTSVLGGLRRNGAVRWLTGTANRSRRMVVDMIVLDGFSGAPLLEQQFIAEGDWTLEPQVTTGFGSPAFLQTPFGAAVADQVRQMATTLESALQCQAFMARLLQVDERQVHLAAGAAEGLRPGDQLDVYRQADVMGLPKPGISLTEVGEKATIKRVYPSYSEAVLGREAGRLNIQIGDVLIVW